MYVCTHFSWISVCKHGRQLWRWWWQLRRPGVLSHLPHLLWWYTVTDESVVQLLETQAEWADECLKKRSKCTVTLVKWILKFSCCYEKLLNMQWLINNNLEKTHTNIIILPACKECTILWNSYIVHLRYTDYSTKYSPWWKWRCKPYTSVNKVLTAVTCWQS